jgi:hypothetical protein
LTWAVLGFDLSRQLALNAEVGDIDLVHDRREHALASEASTDIE